MRYMLLIGLMAIVIVTAGCALENGNLSNNTSDDIDDADANPAISDNDTSSQDTVSDGSLVTFSYRPMQCEMTPWDTWAIESQHILIREPTEEDLITLYFAEENITVYNYRREVPGDVVCKGCDVCPEDYVIMIDVGNNDVSRMQELGWNSTS